MAKSKESWISSLRHIVASPAPVEDVALGAQSELFELGDEYGGDRVERDRNQVIKLHLQTSRRVNMSLWSGGERLGAAGFQEGLKLIRAERVLFKSEVTVRFERLGRQCTLYELEQITGLPFWAVVWPVHNQLFVRSPTFFAIRAKGWGEMDLLQKSPTMLRRAGFSQQSIDQIMQVRMYNPV